MVDFCGVGKIFLFTSIMLKLLRSKYWYFLQETTHDVVMLDHHVFCITQNINSHICLLKCDR